MQSMLDTDSISRESFYKLIIYEMQTFTEFQFNSVRGKASPCNPLSQEPTPGGGTDLLAGPHKTGQKICDAHFLRSIKVLHLFGPVVIIFLIYYTRFRCYDIITKLVCSHSW